MGGRTRRDVLAGAGAVSLAALAGCVGRLGADSSGRAEPESLAAADTGPRFGASFYVVGEFAAAIVGEATSVDTLVPLGQHGHGWQPGPSLYRRVAERDAFVYVGEGFQPWADRMIGNLTDEGREIAIVEAWAGVDLLPVTHGGGQESDSHETDDHSTDDSDDDHSHESIHDAEHDSNGDDSTDGEHHEDHGPVDPHFWLDPTRAAQSVDTVAAGLSAVAPDHESTFVANAAAYRDRLEALDERFRERLADRTQDTVLVAGHDSFQYLGDRYDFRVESLLSASPDALPSPGAVARAQELVAEHDVQYVLSPVFESDRAARQLVAETDAVDVLPLTPVPTLTDAWADRDWGFVDVMREVNLPSLARALGAE